MHSFFVHINSALKNRRGLFFAILLVLCGAIAFFISKLQFEEDINALIPMDEHIAEMSQTFTNSKFADQLVFTISAKDTTVIDQDKLIAVADSLGAHFKADTTHVGEVRTTVDESAIAKVYQFFYNHIPLYMSDADYAYLDTMVNQQPLERLMEKNYKSMISPTGIGTARYILKDPLSIVPRFLKKLESFQLDDNFVLYRSHIFTKDKKHVLMFLDPAFSAKNTKENKLLIAKIDKAVETLVPNDVHVEYYGGTAVAVANAKRVQSDIYITISIAVILLLLLFVFVFKNIKVLAFLFIPVVLGVGVALMILSWVYPAISVIALGVGAILMGISVDFSLHYFSHVRCGHSAKEILQHISEPVLMSSLTTASAFMCLNVVNSSALNQLGMFAGISVVVVSLLVLILLPLLFTKQVNVKTQDKNNTLVDKVAAINFHEKRWWILVTVVLSVFFVFTSKNLRFDADIANLNYLPDHLAKAEKNLKSISSQAASAVYVVVSDTTLNSALLKLEQNASILESLNDSGIVKSLSTVCPILLSNEKQQAKIDRWNQFWESKGKEEFITTIGEAGAKNHIKAKAFSQFYASLQKEYQVMNADDYADLQQMFLKNLVDVKENKVSLVSICKVPQENKKEFFKGVENHKELVVLDKQFFTNKFFELLRDDFTKLINYSMIVVFLIILIFWGRFELAAITFIPIVLSWYWTIGLMGLFDVHFNIFNIIICTFIFGLGIDYAIFITQGLINNYKYGGQSIIPYKVSILLSVTTTLIGVGVLIFAQHPALKSIAVVTILGILSVIIITFTVVPFLFQLLVANKGVRRITPIVIIDFLVSLCSFSIFLAGVIVLSLIVLIFKITPFFTKQKKAIVHYLVHITCKFVVGVNFLFKKEYIDKHKLDLSKPSVIVCNHQSHLDLALLMMQSPKIIVMTNEWVWKNPFYGFIIRYIDFYPIYTGIEHGYEKIKKKVEQGFSVLIFPEGTRTKDGSILRFHQGAFSLADYLKVDIQPVLLHGAFDCLPKTEFFLRAGHITLKFLDRIKVTPADIENGLTYRPQAKSLTKYYREQYAALRAEKEDVDYFARRLVNKYVYKGPVLEWYMRVKIKLEKNYRFYDELLPRSGKIVDVGCGYGFMTNMLSFTASDREMLGWDYDDNKIAVAAEVASDNSKVSFAVKDVVCDDFEQADVFVFNDVLHYFSQEKQLIVLQKAYENLMDDGIIVVRDADTDLEKRTKFTKLTEFFSIKLLGFNKMTYELSFFSSSLIEEFARKNGMSFEKVDNAKYTSNLTYVLKRK